MSDERGLPPEKQALLAEAALDQLSAWLRDCIEEIEPAAFVRFTADLRQACEGHAVLFSPAERQLVANLALIGLHGLLTTDETL